MADLDLNLLKILKVLLEVPNTRKAGEILHLSQSSVSKALSRLRQHFNDPLFVRDSHGLKPTSKALELSRTLPSVLSQLEQVVNSNQVFDPKNLDTQLNVSMNGFFLPWLGTPLYEKIREQAPKLQLHFTHWTPDSEEELLRGQIDIGLNYLSPYTTKHIQTKEIFEDEFVMVLRKGHPLEGKQITPDVFDDYEVTSLLIPGFNYRNTKIQKSLKNLNDNVKIQFRSTSINIVLDIVQNSNLMFPTSRRMGQFLDSNLFSFVDFAAYIPARNEKAFLLIDKVRREEPVIKWLAGQLIECVTEH